MTNKSIDVDELAKEIKRELVIKIKSELPNLIKNVKDSESYEEKFAQLLNELLQISMNYSEQLTIQLIKRILDELE